MISRRLDEARTLLLKITHHFRHKISRYITKGQEKYFNYITSLSQAKFLSVNFYVSSPKYPA